MNNTKDFGLTFSKKVITTDDMIHEYWTQKLKPVFKTETLIYGLLKSICQDITQGFSRMILQHQIDNK